MPDPKIAASDDLFTEARELAGYFDTRQLSMAESIAVCGLYVSTMLSEFPPAALESFKRNLDLCANFDEQRNAKHNTEH